MSKESYRDMNNALAEALRNERDKLENESRRKLASNRSIFTTDDYNRAWQKEEERNEAAIKEYSKRLESEIFKDFGGTREEARKILVQQDYQHEQARKSEESQKQQAEKQRQYQEDIQRTKDDKQHTEKSKEEKKQVEQNSTAQDQKQKNELKRAQLMEQFNRAQSRNRGRER